MKEVFKNKKILIVSDSNIHHGFGVYYIRSFLRRSNEKCYVFNKGLGGNRAAMVKYLYDEEIKMHNPDVVVLLYGGNDMAGWLYDSSLEITENVLAERAQKDKEHLESMKDAVLRLKADKITPVIASCFGADEFIGEKENIQTLADNQEKVEKLRSSFYKRQTMRNMNEKIAYYRQYLMKFAKENDVMFLDNFTAFQSSNGENARLYREDGAHLSKDKGHALMAKTFLEFLGYTNVPDSFEMDELNDKIFKYEQFERDIQYFKHALFSPWLGLDTEEKREQRLNELKARKEEYIKKTLKNYFEHGHEIVEIEQTLEKMVYDYINNK